MSREDSIFVFDRSEKSYELWRAAMFYVRKGEDGYVDDEYEAKNIDPMFHHLASGKLIASGKPRNGGEAVDIPSRWWRAATCDAPDHNKNFVHLGAGDDSLSGGTLAAPGSQVADWTHIEVETAGLFSLFGLAEGVATPDDQGAEVDERDPYGVGRYRPTKKAGRPNTRDVIRHIADERRKRGEAAIGRKAEAAAIVEVMTRLQQLGWPVPTEKHVYNQLAADIEEIE